MQTIAIEGKFLVKQMTGTQRYAYELVRELDKLPIGKSIVVVVPDDQPIIHPIDYQSIQVVPYGHCKGSLWLQVDFRRYCREHGALPVCLSNAAPVTERGITTVHDVSPTANKSFYSRKFRAYFKTMTTCVVRRSYKILTDTQFSKQEISRYYKKARGKIQVVGCGWQHVLRTQADASVLEKHGLEPGGYYFAMSSLSPNKNLPWLADTARLNPQATIAVAGSMNAKVFGNQDIPQANNLVYLGYVDDAQAKALMEGCVGFLFPTFYEGFGLPPLEALACGAPVAVSDRPCVREVMGDAARYVNPDVPCANLAELFTHPVASASETLDRFSWERSAATLQRILRALCALDGQAPFEAISVTPAYVFAFSFFDRAIRKMKRTVGSLCASSR